MATHLLYDKDTGRLKEIFDEEDEFNIEEDGTVL